MIDHTGIGVADVSRSAVFYDMALKALGLRRVMQIPENVGSDGIGYGVSFPIFWIDRFHPHSVRQHTAFAAKSRTEVDAFHAAALKAGGTDNGAPGPWRRNYYAAFVLDPDRQQHRDGLPRRLIRAFKSQVGAKVTSFAATGI
jgi:catechol 2,3-dioxygenase-like lactoylglutathione lyase family enzyme